jgi:hypothetical protein
MSESKPLSPFELLVQKVNEGKSYDLTAPFGGRPRSSIPLTDLTGKDDASSAYFVPLNFVVNGIAPLAFIHVAHLVKTYEELSTRYPNNAFFKDCVDKLKLITNLSIERNKLLMRKINTRLEEINEELEEINLTLPEGEKKGKKALHIVDETNDYIFNTLIYNCSRCGISPNAYLDEKNDEDEVNGCTNTFCLNQLDEPGRASDAIRIIVDEEGIHWLILIVRSFAPGIGNLALAGGFLDKVLEKVESSSDAANREFEEEVSGAEWLSTQFNIKFDLPEQRLPQWDIRARFAKHGMIVGGNAVIYILHPFGENLFIQNETDICCC